MRKILGLTLGATVLMMGYVEGMECLTQEQTENTLKRSGDSLVNPVQKEVKTGESGETEDLLKPAPRLEQEANKPLQWSPTSVKAPAQSPGATTAWDALHGATRLLRTMLLNADKAIIRKNESALRSAIDKRVKSWCAALIAEVDGQRVLLPAAEDVLSQEASRDAACFFEVGARILGVWDIYQTTWEQDNDLLLPALAGLLRCAARHWGQPRARNTAAAAVLVEKLTQGGPTTFSPMDKEFISAAQDILFTAAEQVYDEDA